MSQPILLSDEEEENALSTPVNISSKKQRRFELDPKPKHEVLVLLDDPTPQKPGSTSTPSFVPETPMSAPSSDIAIVKCTTGTSHPQIRVSDSQDKFSGICGVISLESDSESESGSGREKWKENEKTMTNFKEAADSDWSSRFIETTSSLGNGNIKQTSGSSSLHSTSLQDKSTTSLGNDNIMRMSGNSSLHSTSLQDKPTSSLGNDNIMQISGNSSLHSRLLQDKSASSLGNDNIMRMSGNSSLHSVSFQDNAPEVYDHTNKENVSTEQINSNLNQKKSVTDRPMGRKKMTKEERIQLMEEKKLKKEQEKVQKAAQKAEVTELKKLQKEMQKWEKGEFALKSVVAEIDTKVVEMGSVGGHLLTRFAEKGLTYRITSNPVERSIVWTMTVPEHISQISSNGLEIHYVLFVYEADEFCNLVRNELLLNHVSSVRSHYPSYTICYLTSRLMAYINKREQEFYKNPSNNNGWRRPPVEEVIAKLTTHFSKVHSRQCIDEAELAEHVVGLTTSLASCQFRKKLTRLSVNANGSLIPKDTIDRNLIKKNLWLKALISIPKVQPRFAVAIWKKYPTMRSLLSVYMDSSKSVHEKEFLLKDLTVEGLLGEDRRLGEVCSKRVYRILMAQSGSIKTDDVENGADYFGS